MIEGRFNSFDARHVLTVKPEWDTSSLQAQTYEHALGRITLVGHCLATEDEVEQACEVALQQGEERLTHLPGSYITIVDKSDHVSVYADLAGQFPIYFTQDGAAIAYNTSLDQLARDRGCMPDKVGLAADILSTHSLASQHTRYAGISRVPAAHRLHLRAGGIDLEAYDALAPVEGASKQGAEQQLRGALIQAVSRRIENGSRISGDFSGGLDSTSLAFLAASLLPEGKVYDGDHCHFKNDVAGDLRYAEHYAKLDPKIRLNLIELPEYRYNFTPGATSLFQPDPQLERVRQEGGGVHFNGTGADALFAASPMRIYDMWNTRTMRTMPNLAREIITSARQGNADPLDIVKKLLQNPNSTYDDARASFAEALERGEATKSNWMNVSVQALEILTPHIRAQLIRAAGDAMHHANIQIADRAAIDELWSSGRSASVIRESAPHLVDVHFPYLDHTVIRASLQLSAQQRHDPRQFKPLLIGALQGLVPDTLLQRQSKGSYSAQFYAEARKNGTVMRQELGSHSLLARMGIIDIKAVHAAITRTELGLPRAPFVTIGQAIEMERWLRATYDYPDERHVTNKPSTASQVRAIKPQVFMPEHSKAVADEAGIVLYNLKTNELRSLHTAASEVMRALQIGESIPDDHITNTIIENLVSQGFLERGPAQAFDITHADTQRSDQSDEVIWTKNITHEPDVTASDYARMTNALLTTRKLLRRHNLYEITSYISNLKRAMPPSTEQHVQRLLKASHVIGKYYVRRVACQEVSLAAVIAEARKNRRVDWSIGTAPDPRRLHAWPEIHGMPIRVPYDDIVTGKYTKFGTW